jgi:hypothetical protein
VLFGNDEAIRAVENRRVQPDGPNVPAYPAGAVLALVTWAQRDDPHWFGARIPSAPLSVEFVQVAATRETSTYRHFAGTGLAEDHPAASLAAHRTSFVLNLVPVRLP